MSRSLRWLPLIGLIAFCIPAGARGESALVKADSLSLREQASPSAKRVETLTTFDRVEIKERRGEWAQVASTNGNTGWVLATYLTSKPFASVNVASVREDKLNVRRGPGTNYAVLFRVIPNYPLEIVKKSEGWVMVRDFDGDKGWVSQNLVSLDSYVITNIEECNVRSDIGTENPVVFTATRGVIMKVLQEKDGWLKVRHADGDEGWISAKIVFGWLAPEPSPDPAPDPPPSKD